MTERSAIPAPDFAAADSDVLMSWVERRVSASEGIPAVYTNRVNALLRQVLPAICHRRDHDDFVLSAETLCEQLSFEALWKMGHHYALPEDQAAPVVKYLAELPHAVALGAVHIADDGRFLGVDERATPVREHEHVVRQARRALQDAPAP